MGSDRRDCKTATHGGLPMIRHQLFDRMLPALGVSAIVLVGQSCGAFAQETPLEPVRGIIEAETVVVISSELTARLAKLPYDRGDEFKEGAVLVAFDCRRYQADLRAARAELKVHQITAEQDRRLLRRGAAGRSEKAISEAKLEQAKATVESLEVRLDQCKILAPFHGRVADRDVEVHELPQANTELLKIVKEGILQIDLIVPSRWLTWLAVGQSFTFKIDETGTSHEAKIIRLGAVVDPISRTTKIRGRMIDFAPSVRPGMSGHAILTPPNG